MTKLLTPQEVADSLGITPRTLREHVRDGRLPYIPTGRGLQRERRMFHPDDVANFLAEQRKAGCRPTGKLDAASSSTTSISAVIDFTARRSARLSGMPTPSSAPGSRKRGSNLKRLPLSGGSP
ncbi:helix-turn-helix domain-containing protein [Enterovirga rhinocerotis]|uniref:helix-turn-helix domain-containing protein n=1 Tax=Enterovirga rhinocerotis TaxID=1339210 RepID=UPI0014152242